MAIEHSRRTAPIGAHLDPRTKAIVRRIVDHKKPASTLSAWVSNAVEEKLVREEPEDGILTPDQHVYLDQLRKGGL